MNTKKIILLNVIFLSIIYAITATIFFTTLPLWLDYLLIGINFVLLICIIVFCLFPSIKSSKKLIKELQDYEKFLKTLENDYEDDRN